MYFHDMLRWRFGSVQVLKVGVHMHFGKADTGPGAAISMISGQVGQDRSEEQCSKPLLMDDYS